MKRLTIMDIIILVSTVALFIFLLIECTKIGKKNVISDYVDYDSKYKGEVNQIDYIKVSEYSMAQKYLSDFVSLVQYSPKEAYNLVDEYYKEKVLNNYNDFIKKIEKLKSKAFLNAKVDSYNIKYDGSIKYFIIKDEASNILVFKENGVMDYTIYLDTMNLDI